MWTLVFPGFGTPSNTSASTGLFGQPQQSTGGLFSTPQAASAFGAKPQTFGGELLSSY